MRYLVFSDTHGRVETAYGIVRQHEAIDRLIHLGDHQSDGRKLEQATGIPTLTVRGNTDGGDGGELSRILETPIGRVFLTHGQAEAVKQDFSRLLYKADALGCVAALFGHTHVPFCGYCEGLYLLNPGSLSLPAGGRPGSYALLTIDENGFQPTILYLPKDVPPPEPPKPGRLRRLFVDSDGR